MTDWKGGAPSLDLIVAGALFSITLNPLVFRTFGDVVETSHRGRGNPPDPQVNSLVTLERTL